MRAFKDSAGHAWKLHVNLLAVEEVQAVHGIYLPGVFADNCKGLDSLLADESKLCQVVHTCCQGEDRLDLPHLKSVWEGDTADAATNALIDAVIDFFREAKRRDAL